MTTTIEPPAMLAAKFRKLVQCWNDETWMLSDPFAVCTHPAYQQIIGMGPFVIPLILHELSRTPRLWFWALRALTQEDPVPDASRGRIQEMADAWLEWGRTHGWIS